MFADNKIGKAISIGLISLCSSCFKPETPESETKVENVPAPDAIVLGKCGETTFYLKEVDGRTFLITDAWDNNCVVEHLPSRELEKSDHTFSVKQVEGQMGDGSLYLIKLDGVEYGYVDGWSGGGITKLSQPLEKR